MDVFAERRSRLLASIQGVAVFFAAPVTLRNGDVEHEYRQDSDLFYLTGFEEPGSALVLAPSHAEHKEVMFVRPRDPEHEAWDGARAGVEGARERLGVSAAHPIGELGKLLPEYLRNHTRLYYRLGRDRAADDRVLVAIARARAKGRVPAPWPTEIVDPAVVLHEMRLFKSEVELDRMRRAAEITRDAHLTAMRLAAPGRYEYEIEAAMREVFRRSGADRPAYQTIVGSGPNATVLHYRAGKRRIGEGELVLIDAGCEYEYYASDVTRTLPASGVFSAAQRRIYEVVLEAQLAAIEATKPGATVDAIHEVAAQHLGKGLHGLGLLSGDLSAIMAEQKYKRFYPHRTSHWLGMDVYDVGFYYVGGEPRSLAPGMTLTIEPGLYIRPDDETVPAEFRGIGVRIEDDVVVTSEGCRVLTFDIPKSAAEVERACAA